MQVQVHVGAAQDAAVAAWCARVAAWAYGRRHEELGAAVVVIWERKGALRLASWAHRRIREITDRAGPRTRVAPVEPIAKSHTVGAMRRWNVD